MGGDDTNGCQHLSMTETLGEVRVDGSVGFGVTYDCNDCDYSFYMPSNLELFPDTNGLNPATDAAAVKRLRDLRGW